MESSSFFRVTRMAPEWDSSSTTSAISLRAAARPGGHSAACAPSSRASLAGTGHNKQVIHAWVHQSMRGCHGIGSAMAQAPGSSLPSTHRRCWTAEMASSSGAAPGGNAGSGFSPASERLEPSGEPFSAALLRQRLCMVRVLQGHKCTKGERQERRWWR